MTFEPARIWKVAPLVAAVMSAGASGIAGSVVVVVLVVGAPSFSVALSGGSVVVTTTEVDVSEPPAVVGVGDSDDVDVVDVIEVVEPDGPSVVVAADSTSLRSGRCASVACGAGVVTTSASEGCSLVGVVVSRVSGWVLVGFGAVTVAGVSVVGAPSPVSTEVPDRGASANAPTTTAATAAMPPIATLGLTARFPRRPLC
ncbi:MAG: hypothetical protein R2770_10270 [Acidimicrobiales bacterium]